MIEQLMNQLRKHSRSTPSSGLAPETSIRREAGVIKSNAPDADLRNAVIQIANIFAPPSSTFPSTPSPSPSRRRGEGRTAMQKLLAPSASWRRCAPARSRSSAARIPINDDNKEVRDQLRQDDCDTRCRAGSPRAIQYSAPEQNPIII